MNSNSPSRQSDILVVLDAMPALAEAAYSRVSDRLFHNVGFFFPQGSTQITLAEYGIGKTHVFMRVASDLIYQELASFSDESNRTMALIYGGNPHYPSPLATVGYLLEGNHCLWASVCDFELVAPTFRGLETKQREDRIKDYVFASLDFSWVDPQRGFPRLIDAEQFDHKHLTELLRNLASTREIRSLGNWVYALSQGKVSLQPGQLPDSPAIAIIKRVCEIEFNRGFELIRTFLHIGEASSFRFGYFQLSLAGILLSNLSKASTLSGFRNWIWNEVEFVRDGGVEFEDKSLAISLLAALTAVGILADENTVSALELIGKQIQACLNTAQDLEQKRRYLRILGDSLNQGITMNDLRINIAKIMVFITFAKDDITAIRRQNRLMTLFREALEPAKTLLGAA